MGLDLEKYELNLLFIKMRTNVIDVRVKNLFASPAYIVSESEFICLQFRKVLELIALSSLVLNKHRYSEIRKDFHKDWNAKKILNTIKKINPAFFPKPIKFKSFDKDNITYREVIHLTNGSLTIAEFEEIYDKCSSVIHAENPYGEKIDFSTFKNHFPIWLGKIVALMNHHLIELDNKYIVIGAMHLPDGSGPKAHLLGPGYEPKSSLI